MKRILLTVAVMSIALIAGAQNTKQLASSIEKAQSATLNEKKAANPNTWIKYGDALTNAYLKLFGDFRVGWSPAEVMMFNTQRPTSQEQIEVNGSVYMKETYECRELYYNLSAGGMLDAVVITAEVFDRNLLVEAREAYLKAAELDAKGSKTSQIIEKLGVVQERLIEYASSCYALGNYTEAASLFEASLTCSNNPVVNKIDSMMTYNTALVYSFAGNNEKAKHYYRECISMDYDANGENSAALAEILLREGDVEGAKACLNAAFQKYPGSQSVIVSLINLYLGTNDDTSKVLELIHAAQANEPTNATLVYAEGNVYSTIGDHASALEFYKKAYEMDPSYVYSIYAIGNSYFEMAVKTQDEMDKVDIRDQARYDALQAQFDNYLMSSIEPLETAFASTDDQDVKVAVASALKQVYFRYRNNGDQYKEGYTKYDTFLKEAGIE